MALFYRGAGIGTYWHANDPRLSGFTPRSPGMQASTDRLMRHIGNGTTTSPYVSLTRSYGVALGYALLGKMKPTKSHPAYVWEIELTDPLPGNCQLLDPVQEIAKALPPPLHSPSYQHDGPQTFLLGLIDPGQQHLLLEPRPGPPESGSSLAAPTLSAELETLVRALRDAELLAVGAIPAACVRYCYEVY